MAVAEEQVEMVGRVDTRPMFRDPRGCGFGILSFVCSRSHSHPISCSERLDKL